LAGRADDLLRLRAWFDSPSRLLTLTGPPGVGKTSLGQRFSLDLRAEGASVLSLSLGRVEGPDEFYAELGRVADVTLLPGTDADAALAHALSDRGPCLLWLDGLRAGMPGMVSIVCDLLDACPELSVLVSSQARLHLAQERVHAVRPLACPVPGQADAESPAIAMWIARVRRFAPDYAPSGEALEEVAEIVRRLDGLPLAIGLAAGRMELLDAAQILARLTSDAAPQSVRDAIAEAWSQLRPIEARALAQCACFRGGFSVEAAEAVLALDEVPVLDTLQALRDRSLLRILPSASVGRRLELLRAVADHGLAELTRAGLLDATFARHAAFYGAWATRLVDAPHAGLHPRLIERDNLLAVVERWLEDEAQDLELARHGAACLVAVEPVFWAHGPHDQQHALLERAVSHAGHLEREVQAELWRMRAGALRRAGRIEQAVSAFEEALSRLPEGDRAAAVLGEMSLALAEAGRLKQAMEALERALELCVMPEAEAPLRVRMGDLMHDAGRVDEASAQLEQALETYRREDDTVGMLTASINLANVLASRGAEAEAGARFELVHEEAQAAGHEYLAAYALLGAGLAAHAAGDLDPARASYEKAFAVLQRLHATRDAGLCQAYLAWLDFTQGDTERAAEQAEAALRVIEASGNVRYAALVRGRLAVMEAALGWLDASASDVERALSCITRDRDPCLGAALSLHALHAGLLAASGSLAARTRGEARRQLSATRDLAQRSAEVRLARHALEAALSEASAEPEPEVGEAEVLRVGPETRWFALGDKPAVDLARRGAQRRILHFLVQAREAETRTPASVYELFDVGWPGQEISPEHCANRVYNALFELRKSGLRRVILRHDDGYLLDPLFRLQREQGDARAG